MKKAYTAPEAERIGFISNQQIALDFDKLLDVGEHGGGGLIAGNDEASSDIPING